jgi:hypothetical protein
MTLGEAHRLFAFWRRHPPLRVLVAGFVGVKDPDAPEPGRPSLEEFAAAVQRAGGKIVGGTST